MLFSVLIANYNNANYIDAAIDSIKNQTYSDWEIIIVDDCSTDVFKTKAATYSEENRIKIYFNGENQGCGYTKRRCCDLATGQVLGFLDPDDILHPEALETMINAHKFHPTCSLIYSSHYICNEYLEVKRVAEYCKALPLDTPYLLLSDGSIHHFATFKQGSYLKTEGLSPDNKKAVDQDLYYKLEEVGGVFFINTPLYYYRIHNQGISTSGNEAAATLWHYKIIEEACLRRLDLLKTKKDSPLVNLYKARYRKIKVFSSFRKGDWPGFLWNLFLFPFSGGAGNAFNYLRKLPREGFSLIQRSFFYDHKIRV